MSWFRFFNIDRSTHIRQTSWMTLLVLLSAALCARAVAIPVEHAQSLNQLNQLTPNFPSFASVRDVQVSPNGTRVVFTANLNKKGVAELYSMSASGGDMVRLNPNLIDGGSVAPTGFRISPDSQTVVYLADLAVDGVIELFSVPIMGGQSVRLNPSLRPSHLHTRDASLPIIGPASDYVLYRLDLDVDGQFNLYRVPIGGGQSTRVNAPLSGGGSVRTVRLAPDGNTVVYTADQYGDSVIEAFAVSLSGDASEVTRLHSKLTGFQSVSSPKITPDASHVIFLLDEETAMNKALFIAALDGSDRDHLVPLIPNFTAPTDSVFDFQITSDSRAVVFLLDTQAEEIFSSAELYRVPVEGGTTPIRLSPPLTGRANVFDFLISPGSDRVLYVVDAFTPIAEKLFSVPIDGSSDDAEPISTGLSDLDEVMNFIVSGDNCQVVMQARLEVDKTIQLLRAPISSAQSAEVFSASFDDPHDVERGAVFETFNNDEVLLYVPPDGRGIFLSRIAAPAENNEACL